MIVRWIASDNRRADGLWFRTMSKVSAAPCDRGSDGREISCSTPVMPFGHRVSAGVAVLSVGIRIDLLDAS